MEDIDEMIKTIDVLLVLNEFWIAYNSLWLTESDYTNHEERMEHLINRLNEIWYLIN